MPQSATVAADAARSHGPGPRRRIVIVLLVIILLGLGWWVWQKMHPQTDEHHLFVSGRLEGYETNLSPKIAGRIDFIVGREGRKVAVGEQLVKLSDADYQAQLRGATARIAKSEQMLKQNMEQMNLVNAQIAGASSRLAQSREETNAQIAQGQATLNEARARFDQSKADVDQAKAEHELAAIRLQRYTNLVKKGAVTKDEYDQALTTFNNTRAAVASREANQTALQRGVGVAEAGLRSARATRYIPPTRVSDVDVFQVQRNQAQHQIDAAHQDVASAKAERDQIAANIAYLNILSPINGVITARPMEPGGVVTPGQTVLTVLDFDHVYMRGFVPEGRIGSLRIGQKASIYIDSRPNKPLSGKIIEIDPEGSFTPENIYFKDDRVKQVFGIKIGIDSPGGFAKPGMPADATIDL